MDKRIWFYNSTLTFKTMRKKEKTDILKAIPLGGHGEIGKNCWVFECNDEMIIVNFGMMLPSHDLTGVDLVFPSTAYLQDNKEKIKGLILTSAHDDSCGGVFYLLNKINIPKIWGSKLAIETVKQNLPKNITLPETEDIIPRKEFQIGNSFNIRAISNTSSLPDTYGLFIKSLTGNILYTGSYKIDQTPPDGVLFDYFYFSQSGEDGTDLLISDSTNVETKGYSPSERSITKKFDEIFKDSTSRIIIFSYASNLHKFQILFNLAKKNNKKILLCGNYLTNKIKAAVNTGFLKFDKTILIDEKDTKEIQGKDTIVIITGKYGDFLSALIEVAKEEHPLIKLQSQDTVIVSATPPPGTARILAHTIDQLFVQKVQVIGGRGQNVHASTHAAQEEAKFIITVSKPRSFVPSHGEERQMVIYGNLTESMGINPNDIHILKNGDVLELREQVARVANKVPAQSIFYNCAKGLDIDETTMKERLALSEEGTITVALTVNLERNIIAGPEILAEACSFAKGKDWRAFCLGTIELIKDAIKQSVDRKETELMNLKSTIRDVVNKSVLELIGKRPLISVSIQEVNITVNLTSSKK